MTATQRLAKDPHSPSLADRIPKWTQIHVYTSWLFVLVYQSLTFGSAGPGAYSAAGHIGKAPAFSLSGRTNTAISSESPGPAAYTSDTTAGKGPSFSLSGRPNTKIDESARMTLIFSSVLLHFILFSFAYIVLLCCFNLFTLSYFNYTAGPGAYEMGGAIGQAPAFSMSSRPTTAPLSNSPGPAAYHYDYPCITLISLMYYRYSAANGIGKGPAYSLSGRTEAKMESAVPGPGAYTHGEHIGKGPAFSMSGRTRTNLATDSPGPAAYDSNTTTGKGPSFSLSGRPDTKTDESARMISFPSPLVFLKIAPA